MKTFRIGGVHPHDNKQYSAHQSITEVALPKKAVIPLVQHIGAPAKPIVVKGDKVKVGQLIAEAGGFVSANIHSPVSGTVQKIDAVKDAWGMQMPAIFIDVEGDEWVETIDRSTTLNSICKLEPKEIIDKVKEETGLSNIKVVATGGLGKIIYDNTDKIDVYDKQLTLKGMKIIYDKQKAKKKK
mgnify:CR=1 FL=1